MNKENVMVDLETLGTTAGAIIVTIGAVKFDESGLGETFYEKIDVRSCEQVGMRADAETVLWWLEQSDEARMELTRNLGRPLPEVLRQFAVWLGDPQIKVWGNGASFDNVLLADAYDRVGIERPWKFWNDRCYRTAVAMAGPAKPVRTGTHHNALDDARTQARFLVEIWGRD